MNEIEQLRKENEGLRQALGCALGVLSGESLNKGALIRALELGRAALAKEASTPATSAGGKNNG